MTSLLVQNLNSYPVHVEVNKALTSTTSPASLRQAQLNLKLFGALIELSTNYDALRVIIN